MKSKLKRCAYIVPVLVLAVILLAGCAGRGENGSSPNTPSSDTEAAPPRQTPVLPEETGTVSPDSPGGESEEPKAPAIPPVQVFEDPKIERIEMAYGELELSGKGRELDVHYIDGDILYASVADLRAQGQGQAFLIGITEMVEYDISSGETRIYGCPEGNLISDFAVDDGTVCYIDWAYGDECYIWSLVKSDFEFSGTAVISSGEIESVWGNIPHLIAGDGGMYFALPAENGEGGDFAVSEIVGGELRPISDDGSGGTEDILDSENAVAGGKTVDMTDGIFSVIGETGEVERRFKVSWPEDYRYAGAYREDVLIIQEPVSQELYFCDVS